MDTSWRATDGTPLAYAPGTFETCEVDDLARCHFCGFWWRSVGSHAGHEHGLSADGYRALTGLLRRTARGGAQALRA